MKKTNYDVRRPCAVLSIVVVVTSAALFTPTPVQASDVDSPIQVAKSILTSITAGKGVVQSTISAVSSHALVTKEYALDPIVYALSQKAIQQLTNSTVTWINSGFQGSPAYATDLEATLQDAADQEAAGFLRQVATDAKITSPFSDKVSQNILSAYYLSTGKDGFALQNPYTLNQVSSDDAAFLRGDFTKGGFQAWFATVLNPQNNPIGASNIVQNELNNRVSSVQGKIHEELGWGNGVFSFRKCDLSGQQGQNNTQTSQIPLLDSNGKPTGKFTAGPVGTVNLTSKTTCLASHIETPGSVIAGSINHTLGLGADSLVQAKEIDEIVGALMGQLLKNVVGDTGLGGLSRGSTATGGRSYFEQTPTANTSAGVSVVSSFLQIIEGQMTALQGYTTDWQTISTAANATKTALQGSTCMPDAASIISTQVQPLITQAATAIGSVPTATTELDRIRSLALDAVASDSSQQSSALAQASADYDTLLKSSTLPSVTDVQYAADQSKDSGNPDAPSLVTQMNQLAAQAKCGT